MNYMKKKGRAEENVGVRDLFEIFKKAIEENPRTHIINTIFVTYLGCEGYTVSPLL